MRALSDRKKNLFAPKRLLLYNFYSNTNQTNERRANTSKEQKMKQATTRFLETSEDTFGCFTFIILAIIVSICIHQSHVQDPSILLDSQNQCVSEERPWSNETCPEIPILFTWTFCYNRSELGLDELICEESRDYLKESLSEIPYFDCQLIQESNKLFEESEELSKGHFSSIQTMVGVTYGTRKRGLDGPERVVWIERYPNTLQQLPPSTKRRDEDHQKGTRLLLSVLLTENCVHRGGALSECALGQLLWVTTGQKKKKKLTVFLLAFFVGGLGVDRFYTGYVAQGVFKILTINGLGIWGLVDWIRVLTGKRHEKNGCPFYDNL